MHMHKFMFNINCLILPILFNLFGNLNVILLLYNVIVKINALY